MKNKHLIAAFLFSTMLILVGAFFKIAHFEFGFVTGNMLLTVGMAMEILVITIFVIKSITTKNNAFLNK